MAPLISIITINYNNASGLEKTIRSIVSQSFTDIEYIVIDGNSTDGSKEVIAKYADNITYHVSERDKGVYNAMNKGIHKATGKYLLFINSGDELLNEKSIESVAAYLNDEDIVYFDLQLQETPTQTRIKTYPDSLVFSYFMLDSLPHPASFIQRTLFNTFGAYNESLKICSDWEFFITAICKHEVSYKHVAKVFSVFHLDGISSSSSNNELIANEKRQILEKEFPMFANLYDDIWNAYLAKANAAPARPPLHRRILNRLGF